MLATQECNTVDALGRADLHERRRRLRIDADRIAAELAGVARAQSMAASGIWGKVDLGTLPDPAKLRAQLDSVESEIERLDQIDAQHAREAAEQAAEAEALRREAATAAEQALVEARMAYDRAQAERLRCAVAGKLAEYTAACEASDAARDAYEAAQQAAEEARHE